MKAQLLTEAEAWERECEWAWENLDRKEKLVQKNINNGLKDYNCTVLMFQA